MNRPATQILVSALLVLVFIALIADGVRRAAEVPQKLRLSRINKFIPSEAVLKEAAAKIEQGQPVDDDIASGLLRYYEQVSKSYPQLADAWGMRGYWYYQKAQAAQAVSAYQQAAQLAPGFFWFHYNLGVLFLKQDNPQQALGHIDAALQANPSASLNFIFNSAHIYMPWVRQKANPQQVIAELKRGYDDCEKLKLLAALAVKKPQEVQKIVSSLDLAPY